MSDCSRTCRRPRRSIAARWSDDARRRRRPGWYAARRPAFRPVRLSLRGRRRLHRTCRGLADRLAVRAAFPVSVDSGDRRAPARDLHVVEVDRRCARHQRPYPRRARRRLRARHFARFADGAVGHVRALCLSAVEFQSGHPGAVLGDHRHHLVPRHRIPHLLHHGDDDAAGLHVPGARLLPLHVEGSVRDDAGVPADAARSVPHVDLADRVARHPHRLEGQSRQCRARRGGRRIGRRHRRRRL